MLDVFSLRPATLEDVGAICEHRRCMFEDMGYGSRERLDRMASGFEPGLRGKMQAGEYLAWLAIDEDGSIAGGLGRWRMDWPPHVIGAGSNQRGDILNVYTRPRNRRKGVAQALIAVALDRALIGLMVYRFARVGAAVSMNAEDYYYEAALVRAAA